MIEHPLILLVVFPLVAYVIGATPSGVIIARTRGVDLRKVGSGNVGATNVARALGRPWGYLCFLMDLGKGFAPVLLAGLLIGTQNGAPTLLQQGVLLGTGLGAICGHVSSFWLRFRGGKGVATALGVVLGIYPYFTLAGLAALGVWIVVTLATRYVSLGSIVAAVTFLPLFVLFNWWRACELAPLGAFAAVMAALVIIRHRTNIRRLLKGTENKIRRKRVAQRPR
jgi:glycerol-3-phosphate acyltransferase PlsY